MSAWFARAAGVLFAVSFVLPAADLASRGSAAIGAGAALLAALVLPLSARRLAHTPSSPVSFEDTLFAVVIGVYFALLVLQNGVMLGGLLARGTRHVRRARGLVTGAAILPWGVPFIDYERIYRALGLAEAEAFGLRVGFYVWALSFLLLAVACRTSADSMEPSRAGR